MSVPKHINKPKKDRLNDLICLGTNRTGIRIEKKTEADYPVEMARPSDADSAATYDKIVEAALEVLRNEGHPSSVSLRKVAKKADASLGTIGYYFDSKEALMEACLDGYYERLGLVATELLVLAQSSTAAELVEASATRFLKFARTEKKLIELRMITNARRGELHPHRQPEFLGSVITSAAEALAKHTELSEVETRLAVQSMSTIIVRFALLSESELKWLTGESGEAGESVVETYVAKSARRILGLGPLDEKDTS